MMGENHIRVQTATVSALISVIYSDKGIVHSLPDWMSFSIQKIFYPMNTEGISGFCFLVLSTLLFFIGCVLPDIDTKESMLGRYIHIPVKHRTWTHTIWFCFICFFLTQVHFVFYGLFFGCVLHILFDACSAAGIVWTYPLKNYVQYSSGAFVAPHHKVKCYHAGKKSENMFAFCVILISCVLIIRYGFLYHGLQSWISYWLF